MALTAARLLSDLDPLPYPARTRTIVHAALAARGTRDLDAVLDDLHGRGSWERRVALQLATIGGHLEHVGRCLTSGESSLALRAAGPAIKLGIDAQAVVDLLPTMSKALRAAVVTAVRRQGVTALADALVQPVRARFGDREAAALLPACSASVVEQELPALGYAVASWSALARRHPRAFLAYVEHELDTSPRPTWAEFVAVVGPGLGATAPFEPDRVLSVLERCAVDVDLRGSLGRALAALARHDPPRVAALLLTPDRRHRIPTGRALWTALGVLDDATLVRLARTLGHGGLTHALHVLPPARRAGVYLPILGERDLVEAGVPLEILDELPWPTRHAEATRLLTLRSVADDPDNRLEVTARLPWPQAEAVLRDAAGRPKADDRAAAYPLLILAASATRDPAAIETVIGSLGRLLNEQDPVRSSTLAALARMPAWRLSDRAAGDLADQVDAAVQARDASYATRWAARRIGSGLVVEGMRSGRRAGLAAGLRVIQSAGSHLDRLALHELVLALPRGGERLVYDALVPRIEADRRVGRFDVLFAVAAGLATRAWELEDLQDRLGSACRASDDSDVRTAIGLWLGPPSTRDDRVATVFLADPSTITIAAVARAIAARRTDLLDAVFESRQRGRFLGRGVRHVPSIAEYADRWLPRQVARYRALLLGLVDDPSVAAWERAATLRLLGRVPGSLGAVRGYLGDPMDQLADAALGAIAWTDDPGRALPDLVAQADSPRAHVAFAALTRCARFVPPHTLGPDLAAVLRSGKITARKEVCRLFGIHHLPGAAAILVAELGRPGQHRDVRRAIVSSLRYLLDDDLAWTGLESAAADEELATALLDIGPTQIAVRYRERFAVLIRTVAASGSPEVATPALHASAEWVRWDATGAIIRLVADIGTDLSRTSDTWRPALMALLTAAELIDDTVPVEIVLDRLLAEHDRRDLEPQFDAGADRDLPARQRIEFVVGRLVDRLQHGGGSPSAAAVLADRIATRPLLIDIAIRLAVDAVRWDADAPAQLLHVALLCDRPVLAVLASRCILYPLSLRLPRLAPGVPRDVVRELLADASPAAAVIATGLLSAAAQANGWTPETRAQLRTLRRHPDPDVRLAAVQVRTAAE